MKKLTEQLHAGTPAPVPTPPNIPFPPYPTPTPEPTPTPAPPVLNRAQVDLTIRSVEATFGHNAAPDEEWLESDEWTHGELTDTSINLGHPAVIVRGPREEGGVNPRVVAVLGTGLAGAAAFSVGWAFWPPLLVLVLITLAVLAVAAVDQDSVGELEVLA